MKGCQSNESNIFPGNNGLDPPLHEFCTLDCYLVVNVDGYLYAHIFLESHKHF